MIYSEFQDKRLGLLGFGTMRLPTNSDGSIDEAQVAEMTESIILLRSFLPYGKGCDILPL